MGPSDGTRAWWRCPGLRGSPWTCTRTGEPSLPKRMGRAEAQGAASELGVKVNQVLFSPWRGEGHSFRGKEGGWWRDG